MPDIQAPLPAEVPSLVPPPVKATPVPQGDTFFERLAAALPTTFEPKEEVPPGQERRSETQAERDARRLAARLPPGYEPQSGADLTFDPRIAYELALELSSPSEVFTKYGVSLKDAAEWIKNPVFIGTLKRYKEEVTSGGISFKLKAKIQAEDLLTHSYILATDPEVPAAVRADLIKWTAKMAGLEPDTKGEKGGAGAGSGFTLNITFAGASASAGRVIDVQEAQLVEDKT